MPEIVDRVTILEYPERAWENIKELANFPGVKSHRSMKSWTKNGIKLQRLRFYGKIEKDLFLKQSERLFTQSYIDLMNNETVPTIKFLKNELKESRRKRRILKGVMKEKGFI